MEESLGFVEGMQETFKNKPFLIFEASNFSFILAQYMLTTAIFYYIDYVLVLKGIMAMLPIVLFFAMVFSFLIVYNKLVKKFGLKKTFITTLTATGLSFILFFFIGWYLPTAIIGMILLGASFSGYFLTGQMVMADVIDYDEVRTGKRRETSYSGVNALLTKPAVSLAPWIFLQVITSLGFQSQKTAQDFMAQLGIMLGFTLIPAVFILFSAFMMRYFPLGGEDWQEKNEKLQKEHREKEKKYLRHLKEQGKL